MKQERKPMTARDYVQTLLTQIVAAGVSGGKTQVAYLKEHGFTELKRRTAGNFHRAIRAMSSWAMPRCLRFV